MGGGGGGSNEQVEPAVKTHSAQNEGFVWKINISAPLAIV